MDKFKSDYTLSVYLQSEKVNLTSREEGIKPVYEKRQLLLSHG
jgi:hypothetical protein